MSQLGDHAQREDQVVAAVVNPICHYGTRGCQFAADDIKTCRAIYKEHRSHSEAHVSVDFVYLIRFQLNLIFSQSSLTTSLHAKLSVRLVQGSQSYLQTTVIGIVYLSNAGSLSVYDCMKGPLTALK